MGYNPYNFNMLHRAIDLKFHKPMVLDVTFEDGKIKRFDMAYLSKKYPVINKLKNRKLFETGKLTGYGIIWNDDIDVDTETIYEDGIDVGYAEVSANIIASVAVRKARADAGISQKELSNLTNIDQSDISKIERGLANPSVQTLDRIAKALDAKLHIEIR